MVGWVEANSKTTTNLDDLFDDELLSGDEIVEEAPKIEKKRNTPPPAPQSQPQCAVATIDEDDDALFDESEV